MEIHQNIHITPAKNIKNCKSKKIIIRTIIILLIVLVLYNGYSTPLPKGLSYEGQKREVSNVEFLYDLTYIKNGEKVLEQSIFDNQLNLIKEAKEFIILDLFLFNDDYERKNKYPDNSNKLTEALINQKKTNSNLKIYFITDEINNFYGAYESPYLKKLKDNDIRVIITPIDKLKDSNPIYSGIWRTFVQWFKTSGKGWIRNAFSPDSPDVTLRSYLRLINFKANHRKVIVTENEAIISSSNPHDASAFHSNIALKVKGNIVRDIIESEEAVAKLSGVEFKDIKYSNKQEKNIKDTKVWVATESKIKKNIIENISKTVENDEIKIGTFYLSDRSIIQELLSASKRGVNIKIILDANKDAFGVEKNGIPNRQVAYELMKKSGNNIQIKWYSTHGEQFHTKLTYIKTKDRAAIIGGSANLTRRNLEDYNLEANLIVDTTPDNNVSKDVEEYFNRIWDNSNGQYTLDFKNYSEKSKFKYLIYRFQEWSGLCTF